MSIEYLLGVICGIVSSLILFFVIKCILKKLGGDECGEYRDEYDERQILVRGKAYKYGFFAMVFTMLLNGYIMEYVSEWCTLMVYAVTCMTIGILVFVAVSIFSDAYLKLSTKPISAIILFSLFGMANLISPVIDFIHNGTLLDENGKFYSVNLECAILMCCVIIMLFIKMYISRKEEGDEYKES